ncbi:MAG: type IX secretion system membrane protein PorP/SprF, partial [Duncaniella sp.]|nr:type IX secretion system membrane protein PorP/SprF [Duncaniella sp.]
NIPLKSTLFEVMPAVLVRSDFSSSVDVAANVRLRYNRLFYAGVGYRHTDAVSLLLGAEIKGIFLAYAYDWSFSAISRASSGSHEIFAGYNLKLDFSEKNRNKHKSIRIM